MEGDGQVRTSGLGLPLKVLACAPFDFTVVMMFRNLLHGLSLSHSKDVIQSTVNSHPHVKIIIHLKNFPRAK